MKTRTKAQVYLFLILIIPVLLAFSLTCGTLTARGGEIDEYQTGCLPSGGIEPCVIIPMQGDANYQSSVTARLGGVRAVLAQSTVEGGTRYGYNWIANSANMSAAGLAAADSPKLVSAYDALTMYTKTVYNYTGNYLIGSYGDSTQYAYINPNVAFDGFALSLNATQLVLSAFNRDNPQYYMIKDSFAYWGNETAVTAIRPVYGAEYAEYQARQKAVQTIESKYLEYAGQIIKYGYSTEFDIIRFVHDKILAERDYSYVDGVPDTSSAAHNILGVMDLSTHGPVCEAYAEAYAYILNRHGIETLVVFGSGNGGGHAWNVVKIGGSYYYADPTWDDRETVGRPSGSYNDEGNLKNYLGYDYFLAGSSNTTFTNSHKAGTPTGGNLYFMTGLPTVNTSNYNMTTGSAYQWINGVGATQSSYYFGEYTVQTSARNIAVKGQFRSLAQGTHYEIVVEKPYKEGNNRAYVFGIDGYKGIDFGNISVTFESVWDGVVDANGFDGGGTQSDPYKISGGGQLAYLAQLIKNNTSASLYNSAEIYYALTNDIELNNTSDIENWESEPPAHQWTAIGTDAVAFRANFCGAGYKIKGIYINKTLASDGCQGLFGYINGGTVCDLSISESYIKGNNYVGGIAGNFSGNIINCQNAAVVYGNSGTGGIAGAVSGGGVTGCNNLGAVYGTQNTGGIAGSVSGGGITGCDNSGTVSAVANAGGIAGLMSGGYIEECCNLQAVSGDVSIGGIVGNMERGYLDACHNAAAVAGLSCAGGIAGEIETGSIVNCYNTAEVYRENYYSGGIAGYAYSGNIINCYNTAAITGTGGYAGGMTGYTYSGSLINCYNTGSIFGEGEYIGSVAGRVYGNGAAYCYYLSGTAAIGIGGGTGIAAAFNRQGEFVSQAGYGGNTTLIDALNDYVAENALDTYKPWAGVIFAQSDIILQMFFAGGKATTPTEPIKSGAVFAGWYSDSACTKEWNFDTAVNLATTIYAKWTPLPLTGTARINNADPKIGDQLTASIVDGNNSGGLSYKWYAGGVLAGLDDVYTVTVEDLGKVITVTIYSPAQTGMLTSAPTAAVVKKTAETPDAPTVESKTLRSVTLTANEVYEYSMDASNWQQSSVFGNLDADTQYTFYQRIKETHDTYASAASAGTPVRTDSLTNAQVPVITTEPQSGIYEINDTAVLSVTASSPDGGELTYQWYLNIINNASGGTAIDGARDSSYTAPTHADGIYYYYVKITNTNSGVSGIKTASITSIVAVVTVNRKHFSDGNGTENDAYQIATAQQLAFLAYLINDNVNPDRYNTQNIYYVLINDIYLNDTSDWQNWAISAPANSWTPIGVSGKSFRANFCGGGFEVKGIYISATDNHQGLFGYIEGAAVCDLGITEGYINGNQRVGGIAGYINGGAIMGCYNSATVSGTNFIGGIAGKVDSSSLINCYNVGTITGNDSIGGIAGYVYRADIANCYNTAQVCGNNDTGGIVGTAQESNAVINCYNTGVVCGNNNVGAIAGQLYDSSLNYCYYLTGNKGVGYGTDNTAVFNAAGDFVSGSAYGGNTALIAALNAYAAANPANAFNMWAGVIFAQSNIVLQVFFAGGKAYMPVDPAKDGFSFYGWFTDLNYTTEYDFDTAVGSATTIYAKWNTLPLNGSAQINNANPKIGDTLTASVIGAGYSGGLIYKWYADGVLVGSNNIYTVTVDDLSKEITVEITSDTHPGTLASAPTAAVIKKTAQAPAAPILESKTHQSVTLAVSPGYEYSIGGINWQQSNYFDDLDSDTQYVFYQRKAETRDTYASASSNGTQLYTDPIVNTFAPVITVQPQSGTVVIGGAAALAVTADSSDGGVLSYQWYLNTTHNNDGGTAISGAQSASYNPSTDTAGTYYYYVVITNTNNAVNGIKTASVTSNAIMLTVNAKQLLTGSARMVMQDFVYDGSEGTPSYVAEDGDWVDVIYEYSANGTSGWGQTAPINAGTYFVRAVLKNSQSGDYADLTTAAAEYTIAKASGAGSITINGWREGDTANLPAVSGVPSEYGAPVYEYKLKGADDDTYTADKPTVAGEYVVRARFAATGNYNEYITQGYEFSIEEAGEDPDEDPGENPDEDPGGDPGEDPGEDPEGDNPENKCAGCGSLTTNSGAGGVISAALIISALLLIKRKRKTKSPKDKSFVLNIIAKRSLLRK